MEEKPKVELQDCTKRNSFGIKRKVTLELSLENLIVKNSLSKFTLPLNMIESYEFKKQSPFWNIFLLLFILTNYYIWISDPDIRWFGYWSELPFFHKPQVLLWYAFLPGMLFYVAVTMEKRKITLTTRSGKRIQIFCHEEREEQNKFFKVLDEALIHHTNLNQR